MPIVGPPEDMLENSSKPQMLLRTSQSEDLQGTAPDRSPVALLLIDVLNDLSFPENEELVRQSLMLGKRIARLKQRCQQAGIPTIFINDNHGKWRSDFSDEQRH